MIAAIIAAIGALIFLITKVCGAISKGANVVQTKIKEVAKEESKKTTEQVKKIEEQKDNNSTTINPVVVASNNNDESDKLKQQSWENHQKEEAEKERKRKEQEEMNRKMHEEEEERHRKQKEEQDRKAEEQRRERKQKEEYERRERESLLKNQSDVKKKYFDELKRGFTEIDKSIKDGIILEKYAKEIVYICDAVDAGVDDRKYRFNGKMDFCNLVNKDCISSFEESVRLASTDRDRSGLKNPDFYSDKEYIGSSSEKVDIADSLSAEVDKGIIRRIFTKEVVNVMGDKIGNAFDRRANEENVGERLFSNYIQDYYNLSLDGKTQYLSLNWNIEILCEHVNFYLKNNISKRAETFRNKLTSDLEKLKNTFQRLEKSNYNKDDIDKNFGGENETEEYRKTAPQVKMKFEGTMYHVKTALTVFKNFINAWNNIEINRLKYVNRIFNHYCMNAKREFEYSLARRYEKSFDNVKLNWANFAKGLEKE